MTLVDALDFRGGCGDERVRAAIHRLGPAGGTVRLGPDGPDDASLFTTSDNARARRAWGWSGAVRLPSNVTLLLDGAFVAILPPTCTRSVPAGTFPGAPRGFVQVGNVGGGIATNVRIFGRRGALVDGCAPFYYGHPHICHNSTCHDRLVPAADTKPPAAPGGIGPQLLRVSGASGFELEGLQFAHTASWVAHFTDVTGVRVHKVAVQHAVRDGLHFGPGIVKDVSVSEYDSECDDNNFALLGTPLHAENVTLDGAVLRNGRTDAIRVGSFAPSAHGRRGRASFIRVLRFTNLKVLDLKVLASLGLPIGRDEPSQHFAELSDVLFENVTMSNADKSQSGVRLLQLLQPVSDLRVRGVLLPQPLPPVRILVDRTRAHTLASRQQLHPLDGLELSAEAPMGGHHRVELSDRAASYSHIRMGGAPQHCPCACVLHEHGRFACTPPAAGVALLVGEAPWRAASALLFGAAQLPPALNWTGSHAQPFDGTGSSALLTTLQAVGLAAAVVVAAATVICSSARVTFGRRSQPPRPQPPVLALVTPTAQMTLRPGHPRLDPSVYI